MNDKVTFPSPIERDAPVFGLIILAAIIGLITASILGKVAFLAFPLVAVLVFMFFVSWPIRYRLHGARFQRHAGIITSHNFLLEQIDRIVPGYETVSMAFAKQPGHFVYSGRNKMFVRVKDQERLIADLVARAPQLRQFGYEWRRELIQESSPGAE